LAQSQKIRSMFDHVEGVSAGMQVENLTTVGVPPRLVIGVPMRNEQEVAAQVLTGVATAMTTEPVRIMALDDSDDATCAQVVGFAATPAVGWHQVTLVHREPGERHGGLGTAALAGLEVAGEQSGCEYFALMDGDGQHPPATILDMLAKAEETGADLVVASRYRDGGKASGLSPARLAVSRAATLLTKAMFPRRLKGLTDVASGLFLVRVKSVQPELVSADGFKILLAMAVAHDWSCAEVGYVFGDRIAGESKAGAGEGLKFLRLVASLRWRTWRQPARVQRVRHA
jgi:dolichol-phosphate mannosyltransferase